LADHPTPLGAQVISVVSHELRTPLTSIATLVGMIEDGRLGAADRDGAIVTIRRNTERMLSFLDDLNLLANLESAPPGPTTEVDLRDVARSSAVPVVLPDGPPVTGDPKLLSLLIELVVGAVSAVASAGTVTASGTAGPSGWTLRVRGYASGLGTTEGLLTAGPPAGSDPPYRRSVALSVLLAQAIATRHGGSLSFEREPDGQAKVSVVLPA
jgi:light-regulated signal transduction histidine kinase (bacteriophytochrome)